MNYLNKVNIHKLLDSILNLTNFIFSKYLKSIKHPPVVLYFFDSLVLSFQDWS